MKKTIAVLLIVCLMLSLGACSGKAKTLTTGELPIEREAKFGSVFICITIDDFNKLGFAFGDSVDIRFSNGYRIEDVPYYNGYYVTIGDQMLCGYPGYPYICACYNNGGDLYVDANLTDDTTAEVSLHESGKYLSVQNVMSMVYTNERENYATDEIFANFRVMTGGKLADGLFYRAASPCDNQYNRAEYSSALCEKAGIEFILDLADNEEEVAGYYNDPGLDCAYWKSLYEDGRVLPLDMAPNYRKDTFLAAVGEAMRVVLTEEGPFLIHCTEGKDRTGFVCLMIEALAGASLDELKQDYMTTYDNYYGVTEETDPEGYSAIVGIKFNDMIKCLCGAENAASPTPEELAAGAENYLALCGLSTEEIGQLKDIITR